MPLSSATENFPSASQTAPPTESRLRQGGAEPKKPDCANRFDSSKSTEMVTRPPYDEILLRMGEKLEGVKRHRTRARVQVVCINYLRGRCPWFDLCHRIHPFDRSPFLEMFLEWSRANRQADSAQIQSTSSAEYTEATQLFDCLVLENASQPTVNLPRLKSPQSFAGDFVVPELGLGGALACIIHSFDTMQSAETFMFKLDDDMSSNTDLPSWDSETGCWITSSDSHSWTCGSSSVSSRVNSPSWDPQDMDQRKKFTDDWLAGGNSSDTASSECSTLYSRVSRTHELRRVSKFPPVQALEKCERWTNTLRSNQICNSIAGLEKRHYRPPRYPLRCRRWLRGDCDQGYACSYVHDDLDYVMEEDPKQEPKPGPTWVITVHDHAKVKFTSGFHVESMATGFETSIVLVHGIPSRMTTDELFHLLQSFGTISDIRMHEKSYRPTKTAKVFFSKSEEARSALSGLKSVAATLSAEMPVSASNHNAIFKDGTVVVEWHPPGKTWYAGYSDATDARNAIKQCCAMGWDNPIDAQIHKGLPAVGVVTARFRGLPADFNEDGVRLFGNPTSVMWERPKYTNLTRAIGVIRSILEEFGPVLSFRVCPPSSGGFMHKAYAHFLSPVSANAARDRLHGICPTFTGKTRIFAYHVRSLEYRIAPETFARTATDIEALRQHIRQRYGYNASLVISGHSPVIIELHARELNFLGQIKLEFEKVLSGEIVKNSGKAVWDEFFAQPTGIDYLQLLQIQSVGVTIRNEMATRKIRLFGSPMNRGIVARQIIAKVMELRAQQISFIPLTGRFIANFLSKDFPELRRELGPENVVLDLYNRRISVRGGEVLQCKARDFVRKVCARHFKHQEHEHLCPVCFSEPTQSIRLRCGHRWCRACLSSYLLSAITNKSFPLCCLGNEAKCSERIPLAVASNLLTDEQFQAIVEAAVAAYVQGHSEEFHYCPSPDCPQVYRATAKSLAGTIVQCPTCLVRICAACHHEAHDGFSCADDDEWDKNLQEWAKDHDAKRCPGCGITIERVEGCNHMTCINCQTHICWVCLKIFPKGQGIYAHMRAEHGDFGLGPIM